MKTKEKKLLTLLCTVFQEGHADRLKPHLAQDCFYHSQYSNREAHGPQEILELMEAVCIGVDDSCRYFPSLVLTAHAVVSCEDLPQSYSGKHCIRLCQGTPDNLVAFVFLRLNEDDQICEIFFARNNVYLREFVGRDIDRKEIYRETVCANGLFERRLYLNEKTYVHRAQRPAWTYAEVEFDPPLDEQIVQDYGKYKDFDDFNGRNMQYSELVDLAIFLCEGRLPDSVAKEIGEYESYYLVCEGAKPALPGEPIPEIEEFIYRVTYLRNGCVDEVLRFDGKEFSHHYEDGRFYDENRWEGSVFDQLASQYEFFARLKECCAAHCRYWIDNGRICDWFACLKFHLLSYQKGTGIVSVCTRASRIKCESHIKNLLC